MKHYVLQIGRVLGNPAVLQDMAQGLGMVAGGAAMMRELVAVIPSPLLYLSCVLMQRS